MILTHGANSLPRGSGGLIRLPYTLDIARFDTSTFTDGKLRMYPYNNTYQAPTITKSDGKLVFSSTRAKTGLYFDYEQFDLDFRKKIKYEVTLDKLGTGLQYCGPDGCSIISGTNGYFGERGLWCYKVRSWVTHNCSNQYRDGNWRRFEAAPKDIPVKLTVVFDLREVGNWSSKVYFNDVLVVELTYDSDDDADILDFDINNGGSGVYMEFELAGLKISYDS